MNRNPNTNNIAPTAPPGPGQNASSLTRTVTTNVDVQNQQNNSDEMPIINITIVKNYYTTPPVETTNIRNPLTRNSWTTMDSCPETPSGENGPMTTAETLPNGIGIVPSNSIPLPLVTNRSNASGRPGINCSNENPASDNPEINRSNENSTTDNSEINCSNGNPASDNPEINRSYEITSSCHSASLDSSLNFASTDNISLPSSSATTNSTTTRPTRTAEIAEFSVSLPNVNGNVSSITRQEQSASNRLKRPLAPLVPAKEYFASRPELLQDCKFKLWHVADSIKAICHLKNPLDLVLENNRERLLQIGKQIEVHVDLIQDKACRGILAQHLWNYVSTFFTDISCKDIKFTYKRLEPRTTSVCSLATWNRKRNRKRTEALAKQQEQEEQERLEISGNNSIRPPEGPLGNARIPDFQMNLREIPPNQTNLRELPRTQIQRNNVSGIPDYRTKSMDVPRIQTSSSGIPGNMEIPQRQPNFRQPSSVQTSYRGIPEHHSTLSEIPAVQTNGRETAQSDAHVKEIPRIQTSETNCWEIKSSQTNPREMPTTHEILREMLTPHENRREMSTTHENRREIPLWHTNTNEIPAVLANVRENSERPGGIPWAPTNLREIPEHQTNLTEIPCIRTNLRENTSTPTNATGEMPEHATNLRKAPRVRAQTNLREIPEHQVNPRNCTDFRKTSEPEANINEFGRLLTDHTTLISPGVLKTLKVESILPEMQSEETNFGEISAHPLPLEGHDEMFTLKPELSESPESPPPKQIKIEEIDIEYEWSKE